MPTGLGDDKAYERLKQVKLFCWRHAGILPRRSAFAQLRSAKTLWREFIVLARFPEDLAKDAEGEFGVGGGEVQTVNETADFFVGGSGGPPLLRRAGTGFQVAAGAESVEQKSSEALEIGGGGGDMFFGFCYGLRIAREFIEADGDSLAEIHGAMLFAGGNAQEPVAVAEVFIGKAALF